jgi:hypothetical protein
VSREIRVHKEKAVVLFEAIRPITNLPTVTRF